MRLVSAGVAALALSGCMIPMPGMGGAGITTTPEEARQASASLQQSQAAGAAQASRPGDAAMECPAIQAELMASMQDPKYAQAMASMGATAQGEKAKIDAARLSGKATKPTGDAGAVGLSMSANLITMMPTVMRVQKLNELATARKCAFLNGAKVN